MNRSIFRTAIIVVGLVCCMFMASTGALGIEPKINLTELLSKRVPILLEFGRGWCIPCKHMKPILDDMARLYAGKAIVIPVDMDVNRDLVRTFNIRLMPTQVFLMPDGKEFFRNEGVLEREYITQVFSKMGVPVPPGLASGSPGPVSQTPPR